MTSKERVLAAINHQEADRVPLNVWLYRDDVNRAIAERYGSVDALYDRLGIDLFTVFAPGPKIEYKPTDGPVKVEEIGEIRFNDPAEDTLYDGVRAAVQKYGVEKRRAVFCQIGAVFECTDGLMGIEQHLMNMALYPEEITQLYAKLADWFEIQAEKVMACGVDVVHMSDDWGQNDRMLFSPKTWWEMIYPYDKRIAGAITSRGFIASLHSDGYIMDVMDGVIEMGIQVLHPVQRSAGMDPNLVKVRYGDRLTIYGGLDIRYTLPRGTEEELRAEIAERMSVLGKGGGYIFCTDHTVQPDTDLARVELAYQLAAEYGRY